MRKRANTATKMLQRAILLWLLISTMMPFTMMASLQVDKFTLSRNDVTIRSVLEEIEKTTDYYFLYNGLIVDANKIVSVNVYEEPLDKVMNLLFKDSDITYTIINKQIILSVKNSNNKSEKQQGKTISGTVTDPTNMELPGVSIMVKGTTTGTITDINGHFSLEVPENTTLLFSYLGYLTQEIKVGSQSVINIVMKEDSKSLEEVVVVGYSTQRKADLTGAVSSVKLDDVKDAAFTSMSHAIQGKMSGVTIMQDGGAPGSIAQIRIRGLGTLNNNDPLYIIDGIPSDGMNDINPNDIERIDVLKDAASSAIYGSRAANGVVIIKTKRGTKSEKVNITFNAHAGFQNPINRVKVLNAAQRNAIHSEAFTNDGKAIPAIYSDPDKAITRTDWQDEVFNKQAYVGSYDISILGGSERARYGIMGGYYSNEGTLKNADYNRTTVRINTEVDLSKNITIGENLMISRTNTTNLNTTSAFTGAYYTALMYMPDIPVYDENGNLSGVGDWGTDMQNPVGIVKRADDKNKSTRILGNAYLQWDILNGLIFKTDIGYDWSYKQRKWFVPRVPEAGRQSNQNELNQYPEEFTHWASTSTLKYEKEINKHKFMALGGIAFESSNYEDIEARKKDFISEAEHSRYLEAGTSIISLAGGRSEWSLFSYFGRIDYSFDNKYLFAANLRADASSKFSKNNRWGYFPSFSAGWRISEESFFESLKPAFNNFKLRASWGQLGNQNIYDNYPTYAKINATTDNDGYYVIFGNGETSTIGKYESNIPNYDIRWEVTTQTNIGADMTFLDDKLEVTVDYFNKQTSDILVQVPISALAGVSELPYQNLGKVRNSGIEALITYNGKAGSFDYSISGNLASIKNKVESLENGQDGIIGDSYRGYTITKTTIDQPMDYMWVLKTNGLFQSDAEVQAYKSKDGKVIQPNAKAGDIKFVDINGDGTIDDKDRTYCGKGFPDFTYGFNLNGKYKNFDLSMFFQGVAGVEAYNATKFTGMFVNTSYNQFAAIQDRWTPNQTHTSVPRLSIDDKNGNKNMSDFYIENGSYFRLKTITLGYTFNNPILKKSGIESLRAYVTAQNLFTITGYTGVDPELGQSGIDYGNFPQSKTYLLGLTLNF
ncbi:MAG: TonB-dependent receptor [Tannerella sp.]|jgi:TonB-linked SusC/RagA family outer membrane protein|nr:TonB-dependent receptor [Tannerella sp.]